MIQKMSIRYFSLYSISLIIMATLSHCDKFSEGPEKKISPPEGNFIETSYNYITTQDSLILYYGVCNCVADSLIYSTSRHAFHYELAADSLDLEGKDTVTPTCTTSFFFRFSRLSGSSFSGNWLFETVWRDFKGVPGLADSLMADSTILELGKKSYKWIKIDSLAKVMSIFADPDTNTFTSSFIAQYKAGLKAKSLDIDSIAPNCVRVFNPYTISNGDTLTITNYYRSGITIYRTVDTTQYSPDPYIYEAGTMCSAKKFPDWINSFISNNQ